MRTKTTKVDSQQPEQMTKKDKAKRLREFNQSVLEDMPSVYESYYTDDYFDTIARYRDEFIERSIY